MGRGIIMTKDKINKITVSLPTRFWTQSTADQQRVLAALRSSISTTSKIGHMDLLHKQRHLDMVAGIIATAGEFQQESQSVLQDQAIPDFGEIDEVPPDSTLHIYATELVRKNSYNLADIEGGKKDPISSVQQIRDILAEKGVKDRVEQNFILAVVHQRLLGLPGMMGKVFIGLLDLCFAGGMDAVVTGGLNPYWNNSLIKYDAEKHIATLRFEYRIDEIGCVGTTTYTLDCAQKKIVDIDSTLTLPAGNLSAEASWFLRNFEGVDPNHFVFGVIKTPSWRDEVLASLKELERKEIELCIAMSLLDRKSALHQTTFRIFKGVRCLHELVHQILSEDVQSLVRKKIVADACHYNDVLYRLPRMMNALHQLVDLEIRALNARKGTRPSEKEARQVRSLLRDLGLQPNPHKILVDKFRRTFKRVAKAFSSFWTMVSKVLTYKKRLPAESDSSEKRLQTSADALVGSTEKAGLLLASPVSKPSELPPGCTPCGESAEPCDVVADLPSPKG